MPYADGTIFSYCEWCPVKRAGGGKPCFHRPCPAPNPNPPVLMVTISRESLRRMYDALMDACEDGATQHAEPMMEAARVLNATKAGRSG